jgi:UDP-glucose 4-epimerase
MQVLVTGANGFVGQALCHHWATNLGEVNVYAAVRSPQAATVLPKAVNYVQVTSLADLPKNTDLLSKVDVIVHLAARVHQMQDTAADPMAEFRAVNTKAPCALARAAANHGVKRFIYLSSIKVNGEQTQPGAPFLPDQPVAPQDPYAISKYEAEVALYQTAKETGLEVVIIRPPLVYGTGVKANFLSMMRWLDKGYPLPLGAIHNRRSLVALPNLVDLIATCLTHPSAGNHTFLVSDNKDLSTTELLKRLAHALDKPARLLPVPAGALQLAATALGKQAIARRLFSSLQVDISKTQSQLGWWIGL